MGNEKGDDTDTDEQFTLYYTEDVQTFEKAVVHGPSSRSQKSKNDKGATTSGGNESDVEDEDEELGSEVIKRKVSYPSFPSGCAGKKGR